ncbi:MAG: glycosyltransferase family 4 protein [Candidatus Zixiibacteriota bacterium]
MGYRVCFYNCTKFWGGGEKWHYGTASALAHNGWDILFIANEKSYLSQKLQDNDKIKSITIKAGRNSFINPMVRLKLLNIFKDEKPDAIIINDSSDLKLAGTVARKAGISTIIYRRGSAIPIRDRYFNRFLFDKIVTNIIANSQKTAETIIQNNKDIFPENRIKVIYNGIDFDYYENYQGAPLYESEKDEIVIGNAGRMVEQKGQKYLIDIAELLKGNGLPFKILIAGDGGRMKYLKSYTEEKGVSDCIIFAGFLDDIRPFFASIDIFVLTSLWEGFGYVLAEAAANAIPSIAFDISSNPELVEDGKNGYLIPPFEVEQMAEKIVLLANNPELREKLGNFAIKNAREKFSIDNNIKELEDYLRSIITNSPGSG